MQGESSLQSLAVPTHWPALQLSPEVQTLPSSQSPLSLAVKVQPFFGSQASAVQASASSQSLASPGTQAPLASQTCAPAQIALSPQIVPSSCSAVLHWPSAGSHAVSAHAESPLVSHSTTLVGLQV